MVVMIIVGWIIGTLLKNFPMQVKVDSPDQNNEYYTYTSELNLTPIELWKDASDILDPAPVNPRKAELLSVYMDMRTALSEQNRTQLEKNVTRGALFVIDNMGYMAGGDFYGNQVFEMNTNPMLASNIFPVAVQSWFLSTPIAIDSIFTDNVVSYDNIEGGMATLDNNHIIYSKDRVPKASYIFHDWRYKSTLFVKVENDPFFGEIAGEINFLYDQGSWKYSEEIWFPSEEFINIREFDLADGSCFNPYVVDFLKLESNVISEKNNFATDYDCVRFLNINGSLVLTNTNKIVFNTPRLKDASVTMRLNESIVYFLLETDQIIKGKIDKNED